MWAGSQSTEKCIFSYSVALITPKKYTLWIYLPSSIVQQEYVSQSQSHHLTNPVAHTEAETASRAAASYIYFLDNKKSS